MPYVCLTVILSSLIFLTATPAGAQAVNAQAVNAQAVNAQAVNAQAVNARAVNAQAVNAQATNSQSLAEASVSLDEASEPAPLPPPYDAGDAVARGFLGPLAGIGFMGLTSGLATLVGLGVAAGNTCDPIEPCGFGILHLPLAAVVGAGAGLALLYPLGVSLVSDAFGGRGGVGWTYLGGLIGTAIGAGIFGGALLLHDAEGGDATPYVVPGLILGIGAALVGPVIAYEISDHSARTSQPSAPQLTWMPTFNIDRYGATAGVVGMF